MRLSHELWPNKNGEKLHIKNVIDCSVQLIRELKGKLIYFKNNTKKGVVCVKTEL